MSALPTLMLKGKLRAPNGDPALQHELDELIPYEYIIDWFRVRLSRTGIENRVLILKSETASGKSTLFPPELYKALVHGKTGPGIICTQPRVLTAMQNVMQIISNYPKDLRLGDNIGWSTKYNKMRPLNVGLLSATVGTLTAQLKSSTDAEMMQKYRYILIDETHERDLQTDMTIAMLKGLLLRNSSNIDCPFLVLMSATFDPESLLAYFGLTLMDNFIWCTGAAAKRTLHWDWNQGRIVNDYARAAATIVDKIIRKAPNEDPNRADILIFLPGKQEFKDCEKWLNGINTGLLRDKLPVFSLLQVDGESVREENKDYIRAMNVSVRDYTVIVGKQKLHAGRKVILSTAVAETGLTLNNLKYVIDAGYSREIEYNSIYGIRGLITRPAPQSRITQRIGRMGRKFDGEFYPLYPEYIHKKLPELQYPQIITEDAGIILMDIITEQLRMKKLTSADPKFNPDEIDMIDCPVPDALCAGLEKLYAIGFIGVNDCPIWEPELSTMLSSPKSSQSGISITKLGALASVISLPPEIARMILAAYSWECSLLDVITIAAYLQMSPSRDFLRSEKEEKKKPIINWGDIYKDGLPLLAHSGMYFRLRLLLADEFMDGIFLFNAIKRNLYHSEDILVKFEHWCTRNHLSSIACMNFIRLRDDIIEQMITAGLNVFLHEDHSISKATSDNFMDIVTRIKLCIYDGFRCNLLTRADDKYFTAQGLQVVTPMLFRKNEMTMMEMREYGFAIKVAPKYLLYKELSLKYNKETMIYDVIVERICALDGFVSIDGDFTV